MRILGVSCDYHDAAAALVVDGQVVAAAEEERFTRIKHDSALPERAIASCLAIGEVHPDDVDVIVFHEKPFVVASRVIAARQRRGPAALWSFATELPTLLQRNLLIGYRVEKLFDRLGATRPPTLRFGEHHLSHASAAFLPSPFPSAAILTVDGVGEWATASIGHGSHHRIELLEEQRYPDSLGLLYSLATLWCGFKPNDGEYKLMGLAPFGEPTYADVLADLVEVHDDGSIHVDARRVKWWGGEPSGLRRLASSLDGPPLRPGDPLTRREADIARSVQDLVELAVVRMATHARAVTGESRLCLGGGVALNCVANARLLREAPFDEVWVQPAAGDAGSALGAALWYWHEECGEGRTWPAEDDQSLGSAPVDGMGGALLGPAFEGDEIAAWLDEVGVAHRRVPDLGERCRLVAERLDGGDLVGWFQGRMEFGPRALGNRSILADPRPTTMQRDINLRVKGRESFRPFAPAVLAEHAAEWFDLDRPSPFMLFTAQVAAAHLAAVADEPASFEERVQVPRSDIPACTHIDGSARVQTVHAASNPAFHRLLEEFRRRTGCPVLLNTSFNVADEPIVCTPDDALDTARRAGLDLLVMEDCLVEVGRVGSGP